MSSRRDPDQPLKALFWMFLSGLGFSLMSVFVKRLSDAIPQFELVFFRSWVNFVIVLALMLVRREDFLPVGKPLLVLRGLMGFGGVSCLFYALGHLPLSVSSMLNWCSPLFVLLFSRLFLKEKVASKALVWVAVAFAGLVVLLKPDFRTGWIHFPLVAVLIAILGSAFGGAAYVAVRAATARVGVNVIVLYFTGIATLLSAPLAFREFHRPNLQEGVQLLAVGGFATLGQLAMTQGYRFAPAGLVSTMSLMGAVFSSIWGWVFFSEALDGLQWLGLALIATGVAQVTLSSARK